MKKIAVVIAGCGHRDGAEITETVSVILSLSQLGADLSYYSLDTDSEETNHITGKNTGLKRNLLQETARITRGKVTDIKELKSHNFDGLVFPGGRGVALSLCDFATQGSKAKINFEVKRVILEFHSQSKPIAAICIAPTLIALALGKNQVMLTVGQDKEVMSEIKKLGAHPVECPVDDFITDRDNKIITTPAYMQDDAKPYDIYTGIKKAMREFFEMA